MKIKILISHHFHINMTKMRSIHNLGKIQQKIFLDN